MLYYSQGRGYGGWSKVNICHSTSEVAVGGKSERKCRDGDREAEPYEIIKISFGTLKKVTRFIIQSDNFIHKNTSYNMLEAIANNNIIFALLSSY